MRTDLLPLCDKDYSAMSSSLAPKAMFISGIDRQRNVIRYAQNRDSCAVGNTVRSLRRLDDYLSQESRSPKICCSSVGTIHLAVTTDRRDVHILRSGQPRY
jgi:hypothetical protein